MAWISISDLDAQRRTTSANSQSMLTVLLWRIIRSGSVKIYINARAIKEQRQAHPSGFEGWGRDESISGSLLRLWRGLRHDRLRILPRRHVRNAGHVCDLSTLRVGHDDSGMVQQQSRGAIQL